MLQIDYARLAGPCGMSSPRSASNTWAQIRKKIEKVTADVKEPDADNNSDDNGTTPAKATPKKRAAAKPKKAATDAAGDEGPKTPTKKTQAKRKAGGTVAGPWYKEG